MKKRELAVLACRLIALQVLLTTITKLEDLIRTGVLIITSVQSAGAMPAPNPPTTTWSVTSPVGLVTAANMVPALILLCAIVALWILVTAGLWFGAPGFARAMIEEYPGDPPLETAGVDWTRLAYSVVGVFMLMQTLPQLLHRILYLVNEQIRWTNQTGPINMPYYGVYGWPEFLRLIFAVWLTFGTRTIVRALYIFRARVEEEWAQRRRR
jgi:hypothetical protein